MVLALKQFLKRCLEGTKILDWYYSLYPQKPLYVESLWMAFMLSRWVMYGRLRIRMIYFFLTRRLNVAQAATDQNTTNNKEESHLGKVVRYNFSDFATHFSRRRSEHLIYLLRSIPFVGPDTRVLSIGPKSEGEVLLLKTHGFRNVTAIDLFSYSPLIQPMDMHNMQFTDSSFDVICCGYVVRYSNDIAKCVSELVRVTRNGGVIAIAFSGYPEEVGRSYAVATMLYSTDDLLKYFGPHIEHVYWKLDDNNTDESKVPAYTHSVVFRIKK